MNKYQENCYLIGQIFQVGDDEHQKKVMDLISESDSNDEDNDADMIQEEDPELTMLNEQLTLLKQDFDS